MMHYVGLAPICNLGLSETINPAYMVVDTLPQQQTKGFDTVHNLRSILIQVNRS